MRRTCFMIGLLIGMGIASIGTISAAKHFFAQLENATQERTVLR